MANSQCNERLGDPSRRRRTCARRSDRKSIQGLFIRKALTFHITVFSIIYACLCRYYFLKLAHDAERFFHDGSVASLKTHISGESPPMITKEETLEVDECRDTARKQITISMWKFCLDDAPSYVKADRRIGLYERQFDMIEKSLAPYENELFGEKSDEKQTRMLTTVSIPNAFCQPKAQRNDITLTTQTGTGKMRRLAALAGRWNGPLSVAVRIDSKEEFRKFRKEIFEHMAEFKNVAFHFYFEDKSQSYPNNILRNIALDQVTSDFFALFDVDFLPAPINTHQHLQSTLDQYPQITEKLHNKSVFVLPAFEILYEIAEDEIAITHKLYPETKEDIDEKDGIQRFHWDSAPQGHRSTNYTMWMGRNGDVSYPIEMQEYGYEPYIIAARKNIPSFFPAFRGFGMNKLSFYAELHYAKYNLEVLRDLFVFHLKHNSSYGEPWQKRILAWQSKRCIKSFMHHLEKTYRAGHLDKKDEMVDYDTWVEKMEEGQADLSPDRAAYFSNLYWEDLPSHAQKAARAIHFNEQLWDKGAWPTVGSKVWAEMTNDEKEALETLGYIQDFWKPRVKV